jgi:hypothetical protein
MRLLARTCANTTKGAHDDINLGRQEGEDSTLDSRLGSSEGEFALGVIKEPFYEYPKQVVALLELGYLVELEQGAFLRIQPSIQRKLHLGLSRFARQVQKDQRKQETFEKLLDRCQLYPLRNNIFCDEVFQQTTQPRKTHNRHGEEPQTRIAISSGTQFTRDPYLAVVETSSDLRYDYPPMLEALVQLGFLREYNKGVFGCIHDPISRRKAFSLEVLAVQGLHHGLEDVFLKLLILQGELFQCSGTEQQEFYWDKKGLLEF